MASVAYVVLFRAWVDLMSGVWLRINQRYSRSVPRSDVWVRLNCRREKKNAEKPVSLKLIY